MKMPEPSAGGDFTPPPSGTHAAICYRLIDLGTQQVEFQGETKRQHKIMLSWELPDETMEDGSPFTVHKVYTYSSHEKANLRHDLESWRGKAFSPEELGNGPNAFDIRNVLGKGCLLSIVHNEKAGKTYANINSISKLPKSMQVGDPTNTLVYFALDDDGFDSEVLHSLSDNLQNKIKSSPEYQELVNRQANRPQDGYVDQGDVPPPNGPDDYGGDEIPF